MKTLRFLFPILAICFLAACTKDLPTDNLSQVPADGINKSKSKPVEVKIAIISDIHYMDPSLLMNGAENGLAFQTYLAYDPKLIQFSDPIFRTTLSKIVREKPDIVLIPGDLTKDGEPVSHEAIATILHQLVADGIKVYVVPGNHDINNPEAKQYDGNIAYQIPSITPEDFSTIYGDFGYANSISRDASSLSYVCQPFTGLWILGIDDCEYYANTPTTALVQGIIKPETMAWILEKLDYAKANNITVLGLMHHGIVEHYTGQQQVDYGYVTDNWLEDAPQLMNAGLQVMFTGHYHANDITMISSEEGNMLFDIETGSLVTPPSPYRMVTLSNKGLDISTNKITSVSPTVPLGFSFTHYSDQFLKSHMYDYFEYIFTNVYGLDDATAAYLAPYFREGWSAHYTGDEKMPAGVMDVIGGLPSPLDGALYSIWTDLPPEDNKLHVDLK